MHIPQDDWLEAACREPESKGDSPHVMFPEGQGDKRRKLENYAIKKYCRTCPSATLTKCREAGEKENFGIWGGETEEDRRQVRKYLNLFA